jgi:type II restriction enzyme
VNLHFDSSVGQDYSSPSQLARVLTQDWVAREAYCLKCGHEALDPTPQNTKAMDFRCDACREPYELKSSRRPFRTRVLDGEYSTFLRAIESHDNPNLLLLNYDAPRMVVTDLQAIPRYALSRLSVLPRRPLGPTARRAGWQGCNIDLTGLPQTALVPIVISGSPRVRSGVLEDWRRFDFIDSAPRTTRDWLPDILSCLRRVTSEEFDLETAYGFESELQRLHPRNYHVRPKIRQQLQILVRHELIERVRPGWYRKTFRL